MNDQALPYNLLGVIILTYDELLDTANKMNLVVKEKPMRGYDGRIKGYNIAIRKDIPTIKEKSCVLAEEIGHYLTSYGDILDQNHVPNRKQESRARAVAYDLQVGLNGIIEAYEAGCTSAYMISDYLGVTELFLKEAITYYQAKYGICIKFESYVIYFEPSLGIMTYDIYAKENRFCD